MRWSDRSNGDFAQARRVSQVTKRYVKEGIYEIKTPPGRSGVALKGRGYAVGKNRSGSALALGISSILHRNNAGYRESSKIVTTHTARDTQSKRNELCSRSIGLHQLARGMGSIGRRALDQRAMIMPPDSCG